MQFVIMAIMTKMNLKLKLFRKEINRSLEYEKTHTKVTLPT